MTVPAGTFEAFRLRYDGHINYSEGPRSWSGSRTETLSYAPAVKRHVKSEVEEQSSWSGGSYYDHQRTELVSFKAAP